MVRRADKILDREIARICSVTECKIVVMLVRYRKVAAVTEAQ
jgi:hypothetical protein